MLLRLFLVRLEADTPRQARKLVFLAGLRCSDNSLKPFAIRTEIGTQFSRKTPAYSLQYSVMSLAASFTPPAEAVRQSSQAPVLSSR